MAKAYGIKKGSGGFREGSGRKKSDFKFRKLNKFIIPKGFIPIGFDLEKKTLIFKRKGIKEKDILKN
ncbi:hypothetical protein CCP3SC1AL1_3240002 [Gammaproteobacteria bacterium]